MEDRICFIFKLISVLIVLGLLVQTAPYEIFRLPEEKHVTSVPGMEFLPPYISNVAVGKTHIVVLRCKVRSESTPAFQWDKINNDTSTDFFINDSLEERFEIKTRHWPEIRYMSRLIIKNPKLRDSGLYRCTVVSGSNHKLIREFKVNVQGSIRTPTRILSFTQIGQGLLEIYRRGQWMRINQRGFTLIEANLACRTLGYRDGGEPRLSTDTKAVFSIHFAAKKYRKKICIVAINCSPDATDFKYCFKGNVKFEPCINDRFEEVGIACRVNKSKEPDVPLRLWDPSSDVYNLPEGIVEIFHKGEWGFIVDISIGTAEINAMCGTLGFTYGGATYNSYDVTSPSRYDYTRPMIMDFSCNENAINISQCNHGGWSKQCSVCSKCPYCYKRLKVRCWKSPHKEDSKLGVRLAASNEQHSGRVEVLHNGKWGTINQAWLQQPGANAVCKMLGYKYGGLPVFANVPPSSDPVLIDYIKCPLNASSLTDCDFKWVSGDRYLISRYPIGVQCRTGPIEVSNKVRLIGHYKDRGKGRLEYFTDGYWSSVCGAYLGTSEASLFCRMLGFNFGGHIAKVKNSYLRGDFGPVLLKYIECPWNSTSLDHCPTRLWTYDGNRLSCDWHELDVELQCRSEPFLELEIKLFGGSTDREGDLHVKFEENDWYRVCSMFSAKNVAVVCRQLGFRYGGEMMYKRQNEDDMSAKWIRVDCNGKEQNIGQCNVLERRYYGCWESSKVAIKCYEPPNAEIQMTVSLQKDGGVVINRLGQSWNICADTWDDINAQSVCRMFNFSDATATYLGNGEMPKRGRPYEHVVQELYCPQGAIHLRYCFYGQWKIGHCKTDKYGIKRAGVHCN